MAQYRDHHQGLETAHHPLTDRLQAALRALPPDRRYLISTHAREPLTLETTRWHLPRLCRQAGIQPIGWHALRHTFCSHLAMLGVPPRTIQELAGHADLATTLKYMHLVEGETDRAIDVLNRRGERPEKIAGQNSEPIDPADEDDPIDPPADPDRPRNGH